MGRKIRAIAICLSFLMLVPFSTDTFAKGPKKSHQRGPKNSHARGKNFRAGAVYVLTNQTNNTVAVFRRSCERHADIRGRISHRWRRQSDRPATRPRHRPVGIARRLDYRPMVIRFLIAVNAGSNEISVLQIKKNELEIVDVVNSGGIRPISLALHDDLLYVLNEGGTPNITGFDFDEDGTLTPLARLHSAVDWRRRG